MDDNVNQYLLRNDDKYLEYFVYLDQLREGGTINMMGAPREMEHEFGLDKKEARNVFLLWCLNFESAEDPEQYTQREED